MPGGHNMPPEIFLFFFLSTSFVSWNKALWSFCVSLELSFFLTWYFIKIKGEQIFLHFSFLQKFIRRTQRAIYLGLKHLGPFLLVFSGSLQMNARVQERHKKIHMKIGFLKIRAKINWQDHLNIKLYFSHGLSTGRKNFNRKNNRATHPTSENLLPQRIYSPKSAMNVQTKDLSLYLTYWAVYQSPRFMFSSLSL